MVSPHSVREAEFGNHLSFMSMLQYLNDLVSNSHPLVIRNTGACCQSGTQWSTGLWRTGMTWREFGSMFTPKSNCRLSQRRWAPLIMPWHIGHNSFCLIPSSATLLWPLLLLCSIPCCWLKRRWTPARTGRRLLRFSLRLSTFLLSSSPCRLS